MNNDLISRSALKKELDNIKQTDDIRWTDKLSVTCDGDIIDFEGRVVGHINLENMKGGAE